MLLAWSAAPSAAAAQDEEQARLHYRTGASYYDSGDYEDALREFKRSHKLNPHPVLFYNISMCHQHLGNDDEAIDYLKRYLESDAEISNRRTLERRLENLETRQTQRREAEQRRKAAAAEAAEEDGASKPAKTAEKRPTKPKKPKEPPGPEAGARAGAVVAVAGGVVGLAGGVAASVGAAGGTSGLFAVGGIATLAAVGITGPTSVVLAESTRRRTKAKGLPALRIAGWIGLGVTGAATVGTFFASGSPTALLLVTAGGTLTGVFSSAAFAADAFVTVRQAKGSSKNGDGGKKGKSSDAKSESSASLFLTPGVVLDAEGRTWPAISLAGSL